MWAAAVMHILQNLQADVSAVRTELQPALTKIELHDAAQRRTNERLRALEERPLPCDSGGHARDAGRPEGYTRTQQAGLAGAGLVVIAVVTKALTLVAGVAWEVLVRAVTKS